MYEQMYYNTANGYGYGGYANPMIPEPMKPALMTQPLTDEEISLLTDKGGAFSTKVTQDDLYKAWCTHKKGGKIVAQSNPDGSFTCPICGETFQFKELTKESVTEDINRVIDDMQTIKLTFLDMGVDVARQYFPLIPLLRKLPQLAVMAFNNWSKYDNPQLNDPNLAVPYGMAAYNQVMNGGAMLGGVNYYGGQIPAMQPMMAPMGGAVQPVYVDAYGRPLQPASVVMPQGQPGTNMPVTNNQAQAAMMMNGGNEFVAGGQPAGPQSQMVMQPVMAPVQPPVASQPPQGVAMVQPTLAPTTYTPQPQVTVNVTSGQADASKPADAAPVPAAGSPVVDVTSFKV